MIYHDGCYLDRYNDAYETPRTALIGAIGSPIHGQMPRSHPKIFCCGAGGGNAWFDIRLSALINALRHEEALGTNAKQAGILCHFCPPMFEKTACASAPEQCIELRDIAQIRYHGVHRKHKLTMTPRKSPPR